MTADMLHLTNEAYWEDPTSTLDVVFEQLSSQELNGVLIGAPTNVPLDTRQTLPIVAYRGGSYSDMRTLRFSIHAILVAVDIDRNVVHFGEAIEAPNVSFPPVDDSKPVPEGYTASPYIIDARERLALPWKPGAYLFSIIMRDRVSNRVKVNLGKSAQGFRDEEVEKFIAEYRKRPQPEQVYPPAGDRLPCYSRRPESPEIPARSGFAIKIDRVLLLNRETRWKLHGAFRLPVRPSEIVPPAQQSKNGQQAQGQEPAPTAIKRITLLGIGADSGRWTLELQVPSYDPIEPGTDTAVVTGYFALDLMQEAQRLAPQAQTYFIYVFSGEAFAGPIPTALVDESWLLPER